MPTSRGYDSTAACSSRVPSAGGTAARACPRTGLGRGRCGEGVRVDAGQREVPEREPQVPAELVFGLLDRAVRLPGVRALVIAVLQDQAARGRAADMVDLLIQRGQG